MLDARLLRPGVMIASLVLGVGCDSKHDGGLDLDGRRFVSESVQGFTLPEGTVVRIGFFEGNIDAYARCNTLFGSYSISGGRLRIAELGSTEKGCDQDGAAVDEWLRDLLVGNPTIDLDEPRLVLVGSSTLTMLDREVAEPDLPLVGTDWTLDGFIQDGGFGFGDWPTTVLRFSEDGTFVIESGCPTAAGQYAASGQTLTFSGVTTGLEACPPEPLYAQEVATAVLADGATELEIEANHLTLTRGTQGLAFRGT